MSQRDMRITSATGTVTERKPFAFDQSRDRRKRTLAALASADGTRSLEELATDVAHEEGNSRSTHTESVDRVAISLYHNHLPKLVNHDLVEGESDRGPFRLTAAGAECLARLERRPN